MGLVFDIYNLSEVVHDDNINETYEINYSEEILNNYVDNIDSVCRLDENFIKGIYNSIKYSDISFLTEATDDFVIGSIMGVEKARSQIMKLFEHQILYLNNSFSSNEKFIKKYENYIIDKNLKSFVFCGFWFTLDNDIPDASLMKDFLKSIKDGYKTLEDLTNDYVNSYDKQINDNDYSGMLRSKIIRSDRTKLNLSEYQIELYKRFRDGKQYPSDIVIDKEDVITILSRIKNIKARIKSLIREQRDFSNAYFETIQYLNHCKNTVSVSKDRILSTYTMKDYNNRNSKPVLHEDEYCRYLMLISKKAQLYFYMYNIAYGEKLMAIRDCYKQDSEIILEYVKKGD